MPLTYICTADYIAAMTYFDAIVDYYYDDADIYLLLR